MQCLCKYSHKEGQLKQVYFVESITKTSSFLSYYTFYRMKLFFLSLSKTQQHVKAKPSSNIKIDIQTKQAEVKNYRWNIKKSETILH